jgi:hypothetical protein
MIKSFTAERVHPIEIHCQMHSFMVVTVDMSGVCHLAKNVRMANREELIFEQPVTETDEFHKTKVDKLTKNSGQITQKEIAVKLGIS